MKKIKKINKIKKENVKLKQFIKNFNQIKIFVKKQKGNEICWEKK